MSQKNPQDTTEYLNQGADRSGAASGDGGYRVGSSNPFSEDQVENELIEMMLESDEWTAGTGDTGRINTPSDNSIWGSVNRSENHQQSASVQDQRTLGIQESTPSWALIGPMIFANPFARAAL